MKSMLKIEKPANEKREKDIKYLIKNIEKNHFDSYRFVEKSMFIKSFEKAQTVEKKYFPIAIQESLALLKDAHTFVSDYMQDNLVIRFHIIDGKVYVIGIDKRKREFLGSKIIKINGFDIEEVIEKISVLSSNENQEVFYLDIVKYLRSNRILSYFGFSSTDKVTFITSDAEFEIEQLDEKDPQWMSSVNPVVWNKEISETDKSYCGNGKYQFIIEKNTLLFQYNSCDNNNYTDKELTGFQKDLIKCCKQVKSIVVDLRLNTGGSTNIMESTFKKFPKNKPIYVAIGRKTFSSAMHHLLYLKREKGAILVGENAGQKPNRFGDCKMITLPNSKIDIHCSYKYFELLPGSDLDVIEPDIKIPITIKDYINDVDPLRVWMKEKL